MIQSLVLPQRYPAEVTDLISEGEIGSGTCGQVFKVRFKKTGHVIAVKVRPSWTRAVHCSQYRFYSSQFYLCMCEVNARYSFTHTQPDRFFMTVVSKTETRRKVGEKTQTPFSVLLVPAITCTVFCCSQIHKFTV